MPLLVRLFLQWAIKQILLKYGKKVGIKTFRKALLFLGKKYFNNVLKTKISKNGKEFPLEQWINEASLKELNEYFRGFGVEITPKEPSLPQTPIQNKYDIKWDKYSLDKKHAEIEEHAPNRNTNDWYTLKGHKMSHPPKPEL